MRREMGSKQPVISAAVHLAVHAQCNVEADGLVQRTSANFNIVGERCQY
jgi:hypothetical protein